MDLYITNPKFELVGVIDSYTSLIWTERYNDCSDFEIMISANDKNIDILQNGYYIKRTDTDRVGIIETKTTQTNEETGDYIIVSGRMLESILDRRIVWQQTTLNGSINESVHRLLIENAISPSIKARTRITPAPAGKTLKYQHKIGVVGGSPPHLRGKRVNQSC